MLTSKNDFKLTLYTLKADRCIYIPSPYLAVNTFHLGYKNQSVYAIVAQVAICSQINTKHINTVCVQTVQLFNDVTLFFFCTHNS